MANRSAVGFSVELFLEELRTEHFGRAVRVVRETTSTIEVARQWLREEEADGAVVIAETQTRGRGRRGKHWASPRGGLWLSVIARPAMEVARAGRLGLGMGLAAAEAVSAEAEAHGAETHGVECVVGLKWPNDLMIGGRKVGGVLVEAETGGRRITEAVLSLGLNANLSVRDLPEEVRESATTLRDETGREHRIEVLAARVLENLERAWPEIVGGGEELAEKWRARDVLMGREVSVEVGGVAVRGRASGIDADGALVIAASAGERRLFAGEAAAVRIVGR